jgi:hypothetical protein
VVEAMGGVVPVEALPLPFAMLDFGRAHLEVFWSMEWEAVRAAASLPSTGKRHMRPRIRRSR